MIDFLDDLCFNLYGRKYSTKEICVTCGSEKVSIVDFDDDLSWKE